MTSHKSILFVQNGDFAEAYWRFAEGGAETYRDQKASVEFVAGVASDAKVTTFAFGEMRDQTELAPNLWAVGAKRQTFDAQQIYDLFQHTQPTHIVLRSPHLGILREAAKQGMYVLPIFADIFSNDGFRGRYRSWKLRRALEACKAPCYSNHSLNASRSLAQALSLPPSKIVPWDWTKVPMAGEAKSGLANPMQPTAFYAGTLSEDKGVGDCLEAIALLRKGGLEMRMSFAGPGVVSDWQSHADRLGISRQVTFLGRVSNAEVRTRMHTHDFVVVPSRHSYPEGLPNVIYEGLASRSALLISDHPAFAGRIAPEKECLTFEAANPASLATCLKRAVSEPELYQRLSENAPRAHDQLYVGMEWTALVTAFLDDPVNQSGWVEKNSLQALQETA